MHYNICSNLVVHAVRTNSSLPCVPISCFIHYRITSLFLSLILSCNFLCFFLLAVTNLFVFLSLLAFTFSSAHILLVPLFLALCFPFLRAYSAFLASLHFLFSLSPHLSFISSGTFTFSFSSVSFSFHSSFMFNSRQTIFHTLFLTTRLPPPLTLFLLPHLLRLLPSLLLHHAMNMI